MKATEGDESSLFAWDALVPHVVHPAQAAIIEALGWIGQPMSPTELRNAFDDPTLYLSLVSYHVRRLVAAGVVEPTGHRPVRGARETFYFFPSEN